jgi:hypothetical protein
LIGVAVEYREIAKEIAEFVDGLRRVRARVALGVFLHHASAYIADE